MPLPLGCEEVRRSLVESGREALGAAPAEVRAHLETCPRCARLREVLRDAGDGSRPGLYTPELRWRTLTAVRDAATAPAPGIAWLLLPPAAAGALLVTVVELWLVVTVLQSFWVAPALAWAIAGAVALLGSSATAGLVALFVDRPRGTDTRAAGPLRPLEV
ncbi:MAG: zf-HC2 domain-containing protein [Thermoanaerobaculaceae bacterium]